MVLIVMIKKKSARPLFFIMIFNILFGFAFIWKSKTCHHPRLAIYFLWSGGWKVNDLWNSRGNN